MRRTTITSLAAFLASIVPAFAAAPAAWPHAIETSRTEGNYHGASTTSEKRPAHFAATTPGCIPDDDTYCLLDGRYRVNVTWAVDRLGTGFGQVPYLDVDGASIRIDPGDSALFWFFGPANWEILLKMVHACSLGGHNWLFLAATTDVGFTVTVTDAITGSVRQYTNIEGHKADTVNDTKAFICVEPTIDILQTPINTAIETNLLANDYGMTKAVGLVESPNHGDFHMALDGTFRYTPNIGFTGTENLTYVASDSQGHIFHSLVQINVRP